MAGAPVVASATGSNQARISRRCGKPKLGEAERFAQGIELLVAGLEPGGIAGQRLRLRAELGGDKAQCLGRYQFARPQQTTGVAQGAKLQREAELVVPAPAAVHRGEVGPVQGPVPHQVGFRGGQGEQALQLRLGERAASRHGRMSQIDYSLRATV
jgi:hypothetical protein